jgi:O-acetyl-ADP-ribose deacetylase (regulator of RNase III)
MQLILVDRGKEFSDILRWQFRSHPEVQVVCGRFEDLPSFDCVVTAGNSFGLMDAGMDLADSLACPGLGTGTGGMDSLEAALQLCLAYEHYQRPPQFINPSVAQQRHERIYYGGRWGFTQPRQTGT